MTKQNEPGRDIAVRPGPLLEVRDAVKDYPGHAGPGPHGLLPPGRRGARLARRERRRQVHAHQGAGRGAIQLTAGTIEIDGVEVDIRTPQRAQALGVSVVHQHGNLVADLSITENVLMVEGLGRRAGILVNWRAAHRPHCASSSTGSACPTSTRTARSPPSDRTSRRWSPWPRRWPATRASSSSTSRPRHCSRRRSTRSSTRCASWHEEGIGFVFVTHRLNEVFKVCDRITVMRDGAPGRHLGRLAELDHDSLVDQLVGAGEVDLPRGLHRWRRPPGDVVLEVRGLRGDVLRGLDFVARAGEVVGHCQPARRGRRRGRRVALRHVPRPGRDPRGGQEAPGSGRRSKPSAAGMALVPRDRLGQGLVGDLSSGRTPPWPAHASYVTDPVFR